MRKRIARVLFARQALTGPTAEAQTLKQSRQETSDSDQ
jgi:hypothetical protein